MVGLVDKPDHKISDPLPAKRILSYIFDVEEQPNEAESAKDFRACRTAEELFWSILTQVSRRAKQRGNWVSRSGIVQPSQVPINIIQRGKTTLILNTRSAQALMRAGVPRSQWNAVNRTWQNKFEKMLRNQLRRSRLGPSGTPTSFPLTR
jgi:hypothetical protein